MTHLFQKLDDALIAGYEHGRRFEYRGYAVQTRDISTSPEINQHFGLTIRPSSVGSDILPSEAQMAFSRDIFARSTTVWFSDDKNRMGRSGCYRVMFAPGQLALGIEQAKRAIDALYDVRPEASVAHCNWALGRAQTDQRQQKKRASRAGRHALNDQIR